MKFSKEGSSAIRDIAAARVAIFNGDPKAAMNLIAKAKASVGEAELEAPTFTVKMSESVAGTKLGATSETTKAEMIPVGGQLALAMTSSPRRRNSLTSKLPTSTLRMAKVKRRLRSCASEESK